MDYFFFQKVLWKSFFFYFNHAGLKFGLLSKPSWVRENVMHLGDYGPEVNIEFILHLQMIFFLRIFIVTTLDIYTLNYFYRFTQNCNIYLAFIFILRSKYLFYPYFRPECVPDILRKRNWKFTPNKKLYWVYCKA